MQTYCWRVEFHAKLNQTLYKEDEDHAGKQTTPIHPDEAKPTHTYMQRVELQCILEDLQ